MKLRDALEHVIKNKTSMRLSRGLGIAYSEDDDSCCLTLSRIGVAPSRDEVNVVMKELHMGLPYPRTKFKVAPVEILDGVNHVHHIIRIRWHWMETSY